MAVHGDGRDCQRSSACVGQWVLNEHVCELARSMLEHDWISCLIRQLEHVSESDCESADGLTGRRRLGAVLDPEHR